MLWEPRWKIVTELGLRNVGEVFTKAMAVKLGFEAWEQCLPGRWGEKHSRQGANVQVRGMFVDDKKFRCSRRVKCVEKDWSRVKYRFCRLVVVGLECLGVLYYFHRWGIHLEAFRHKSDVTRSYYWVTLRRVDWGEGRLASEVPMRRPGMKRLEQH